CMPIHTECRRWLTRLSKAPRSDDRPRRARRKPSAMTARDNWYMAAIHYGAAEWPYNESGPQPSPACQEAGMLRQLHQAGGPQDRTGLYVIGSREASAIWVIRLSASRSRRQSSRLIFCNTITYA